jgi:hypothetical protein
MEIVRDQRLDRRTILIDICSIARARDGNRVVWHHYLLWLPYADTDGPRAVAGGFWAESGSVG